MLHHGTDQRFDGQPTPSRCGWVWYTDDPERAAAYGSRIVTRDDSDLAVLNTDADNTEEWIEDLRREDVEIGDLVVDPTDPADCEPHQVLAGPCGPEIARRVRSAGFDGVRHWEDHPDAGEGIVLAVAN